MVFPIVRDFTSTPFLKDSLPDKNPGSGVSSAPFFVALDQLGRSIGCPKDDPVAQRVLQDYGAVFVARNVVTPSVCLFSSEDEVSRFQNDATYNSKVIGGATVELQPLAMQALDAAIEDARQIALKITPLSGTEAGRRSYADTVRLWKTRFERALIHWRDRGRLSDNDVEKLRNLSIHDQVAKVLDLEKEGIFFSQDFSKSILYSASAPGASQHISMLAFDVVQYNNPRIRAIMAKHGWFQTVKGDVTHFTYIGVEESDLPRLGLVPVTMGSQVFWVPNLPTNN